MFSKASLSPSSLRGTLWLSSKYLDKYFPNYIMLRCKGSQFMRNKTMDSLFERKLQKLQNKTAPNPESNILRTKAKKKAQTTWIEDALPKVLNIGKKDEPNFVAVLKTDIEEFFNSSVKIPCLRQLQLSKISVGKDLMTVHWLATGDMEHDIAVDTALRENHEALRIGLNATSNAGCVRSLKWVQDNSEASHRIIDRLLEGADMGQDEDYNTGAQDLVTSHAVKTNESVLLQESTSLSADSQDAKSSAKTLEKNQVILENFKHEIKHNASSEKREKSDIDYKLNHKSDIYGLNYERCLQDILQTKQRAVNKDVKRGHNVNNRITKMTNVTPHKLSRSKVFRQSKREALKELRNSRLDDYSDDDEDFP